MSNRLRSLLRDRATTYGLWVTTESPSISELAATIGLDWTCVDLEHGHLGYKEVLEHARAVRGSSTNVLVRVPSVGHDAIRRVLDIGVDGVLLPLIRSADDVRTALAWAKYPLTGQRGIGGERAVSWGLRREEYLARANDDILVIPLIETREAVERIQDIISLDGVDSIFFGPADLSATAGYLGAWEGPGIGEEILSTKALALKCGVASGILALSVKDAIMRRDQGFNMIALGSDTGLVIRAVTEALDALGRDHEHGPL